MSLIQVKPKISLKAKLVSSTPLKYIDLFCGIGSFHFSFAKLGWTCVIACDINPTSQQTYAQNYGQQPLGDIVDIDPQQIPGFDILCGGFPCQPFSNIGQHKGFNDERGTMFSQLMKFTKHHRPKVVVLENVPALLSHDKGQTFTRISNELIAENYVVKHSILRCDDYGIPQMRKRLFVIAIRQDIANQNQLDGIFDYSQYFQTITLSQYLGQNFENQLDKFCILNFILTNSSFW